MKYKLNYHKLNEAIRNRFTEDYIIKSLLVNECTHNLLVNNQLLEIDRSICGFYLEIHFTRNRFFDQGDLVTWFDLKFHDCLIDVFYTKLDSLI
jgi:hypothetical protein